MKLEGMNIKKRLNFGYSVVIALMVVSGIVGIFGLFALNSGLKNFVNGANAADTAVKICRIDINIAARSIREMALNDDTASYEGYKQKVVEKLENVDVELKILKETGLIEDELYQKYVDAITEWGEAGYILREARLYCRLVEQLLDNGCIPESVLLETECFWNQIMMEHALFIRGLLDPTEEELIMVADAKLIEGVLTCCILHEQHGICAYCMKRIRMDSHSRVEHLVPLSKDKAIDYMNMLGVCDGGEKVTDNQGHILCCDAHKKETEIELSPLNKVQMGKIAYDKDGRIFTEPKDVAMETAINDVLLINGIQKKDGTVRDTSTELLKGRRDAYDRARRIC